jgi:hypothetical protein
MRAPLSSASPAASSRVSFEVVHRNQGKLPRKSQAFGSREADEECPDQTRSHRNSDALYLVQLCPGVVERLLHHTIETFEVGAGGHLGDDAAVAFVLCLSVDDV